MSALIKRAYSRNAYEAPVCLCINCFNYLKDLPEGKIKGSIKEFLIGNVI